MVNILVLCTGNSVRSIMLEYILNGDSRITAYSAGSQPDGVVHPLTLSLLRDKGHDVSGARSKSWEEFAQADALVMDAVITICGNVAKAPCPIWPGAPARAHWAVDDPSDQPEAQWRPAFESAYMALLDRAQAFKALPFEDMDRDALQAALRLVEAEHAP